jgi:hypothetical protein
MSFKSKLVIYMAKKDNKHVHLKPAVAKSKLKYRSEDAHVKMYKKKYHEVKYSNEHSCPICSSRIDENGYCSGGSGGS